MSLQTQVAAGLARLVQAVNALAARTPQLQTATLSVMPAQHGQAQISLPVAAVTASTLVQAQLVPNSDWDADELQDVRLLAQPGAGVLVFTLAREGPLVGEFNVVYQLM